MTEAATKKGQRTRERIRSAAARLFHEQGVNATSIGDVIRVSGTGKGQFYQHFPSREALIVDVFRGHREVISAAPQIDSWETLEAWMIKFHRAQKAFGYERGCPVGTAGYALQPGQDELRELVHQSLGAMRINVEGFLRTERDAGRLLASANPRRLAEFVIASVQGGMLLCLVERRPAPLLAAIREALAHLRSFSVGL